MLEKETCAIRMQKAMSLRQMRQIELSEKTGIPKSAVSQYLSGNFEPKQDRIFLIAKALNVDEAWLMGYDVPMEKPEKKGFHLSWTYDPVVGDEYVKLIDAFTKHFGEIGDEIFLGLDDLNESGLKEISKRIDELSRLDEYKNENRKTVDAEQH